MEYEYGTSVCEGESSVAGFLQLVNLQGAETASSSAPGARDSAGKG